MKQFLKNQTGAVIVVIIIVLVLSVAGGGAAFLVARMVVSGDGNILEPFEEIGWIEPKSNQLEEKANDDNVAKKTSGSNKTEYLVEESRLSSEAKKAGIDHYYGAISMSDQVGDSDDEMTELYDLINAGVNIYAKDGKTIEIEFGFDITEFCKKAYKEYAEDFEKRGVESADDLQDMMMSILETIFDGLDEEYSDYIKKYVEGGSFQLYVTEKGFKSLYETYNIKDGEEDVDVLIQAIEKNFSTKIKIVN